MSPRLSHTLASLRARGARLETAPDGGVSPDAIAALEEQLGVRLPADLDEFYITHHWIRSDAFRTFPLDRIEAELAAFSRTDRAFTGCIPIASFADGGLLLLDLEGRYRFANLDDDALDLTFDEIIAAELRASFVWPYVELLPSGKEITLDRAIVLGADAIVDETAPGTWSVLRKGDARSLNDGDVVELPEVTFRFHAR